MKNFEAGFLLHNPHIQTIYSSLFVKEKKLHFEIEKFILSDKDFVECYWLHTNKQLIDTPIVILFHGLTGSYESPYIRGMMCQLEKSGFNSVLMHFRGCSGTQNNLPRSYHSGESGDALEFIKNIKKRFPNSKLYAVAYSLGANMLLKLLGEEKENSLLEKVVAISPPMKLDVCANKMNNGFSKYYQYRLIKDLKITLQKKYIKHNMKNLLKLEEKNIKNIKSFWDYDEAYTAPIHGFLSAKDYYEKCSSKQFLKDIQTQTVIIHSQDDPFMTKEVIPTENELSKYVELKVTKKGGHVGFIGGSFFKPEFWLEKFVIDYLLKK